MDIGRTVRVYTAEPLHEPVQAEREDRDGEAVAEHGTAVEPCSPDETAIPAG